MAGGVAVGASGTKIEIYSVPTHEHGEYGKVVPVCSQYYQKKQTPQSPVVFDTNGLSKNAMINGKGVFEIDIYVSTALEKVDGSGNGLGVPESPEGWSFVGEIIGVEPRPYQLFDLLGPQAKAKLSASRWIKFDLKRGKSPDISILTVGA